MKFYLFAFLIATVLIQSCNNSRPKNPKDTLKDISKLDNINIGNLNYQFELPPDWIRLDTTLQNVHVCLLFNGDSVYNPMINITTESMHGKYHRDYVTGTQNSLTDIEVIDNGHLSMLNNNCLWYTYENRHAQIPRDITFYSIEVNGISYNISGGTNPGGQKKYKETFDKIVKSFSLN